MLMNEQFYLEARIGKSLSDGSWETDEDGNPIVIIEASNDNLDFQEEKVLQQALLDSKDYFLQNGVISYDHMHKPTPDVYQRDPEWNEEKYILGHPIDVWLDGKIVKVKAVLYKTVDRAIQILKKLQANGKTVKASVGGIRPEKRMIYDQVSGKDVSNIIKVLWDEVALTYKPVNQTLGHTILSPREFVKSLTAGNSANPSEMTGGNALQVESLEGKKVLSALMTDIGSGKIGSGKEVIYHLKEKGFSDDQVSAIVKVLNDNENLIGEVQMSVKTADEVKKSVDNTVTKLTEILQKAQKAPAVKKAEGLEDEDVDKNDDYEEEVDEKIEKSIAGDEEFMDITEELGFIMKSLKTILKENKEMKKSLHALEGEISMQKSIISAIGENSVAVSEMTKSIADQPIGSKSVQDVSVISRFQKSLDEELGGIGRARAVEIAKIAVKKGITPDSEFVSKINYSFQKSLPLTADQLSVLKQTAGGM